MLSWLGARRSAIVIDIGAAGLRACQFQMRGGSPHRIRTLDALEVDTPYNGDPGAGASGSDRTRNTSDEPGSAPPPAAAPGLLAGPALAGAGAGVETVPPPVLDPVKLRRLVGQGRFVGEDIALVLSPPEVQFFPLYLPDSALRQPDERIRQALRFEVAQESRCGADELEVRFWRLPPAGGHGQGANVMAAVLRSAQAVDWAVRLEAERLRLRRIDVAPCALVRLAESAWTPADTDLWGVLDVGLRHSTITLVAGRVPVYVRSLSVSAHAWTRLLADAFEVSLAVAEQMQREHAGSGAPGRRLVPRQSMAVAGAGGPAGLSRRVPQGAVADCRHASVGEAAAAFGELGGHSDLEEACAGVLRSALESLATEVGRCFSYGMQRFPGHAVRCLWLAGGGAQLASLTEILEQRLELPVRRLSVETEEDAAGWSRLPQGLRFSTRAAVAVGAALLCLENE